MMSLKLKAICLAKNCTCSKVPSQHHGDTKMFLIFMGTNLYRRQKLPFQKILLLLSTHLPPLQLQSGKTSERYFGRAAPIPYLLINIASVGIIFAAIYAPLSCTPAPLPTRHKYRKRDELFAFAASLTQLRLNHQFLHGDFIRAIQKYRPHSG